MRRKTPSKPTPQAEALTSVFRQGAVLYLGMGLLVALAVGDWTLLLLGAIALAVVLPFFRNLSHLR
jgi:hypothetical protein